MALLFMDSFDLYATADLAEKWIINDVGGAPAPTLTIGAFGRRSSNGLRALGGGASLNITAKFPTKVFASSGATVIVGFAWTQSSGAFASVLVGTNVDDLSDNTAVVSNALVAIRQGSVTQGFLRLNTNGTLSYVRGPGGTHTVLGTSTNAFLTGTTYYVELKVLIDNSAGTVDVNVNGASWLSLTTQDTQSTASATWNELWFNKTPGPTVQWDMDDLYVLDGTGSAPWNTFLGDSRCDARYETAAGATTGWTPSTGSNYQNVDETAPNDDTDYNSAASTGLTDTFIFQDAPVVGATIYGIQHNISMKKTDAGICTIAPVVRHSGVDNVGSSLSPGTTYTYGLAVNQVNPGTGLAWTEADFNAAEFGYKRVT